MSTATDERVDLELIEALDFEHTPPCESEIHSFGQWGHAGPAYALLRFEGEECGCVLVNYRCRGNVEAILAWTGLFKCHTCRNETHAIVTVLGYVGGSA